MNTKLGWLLWRYSQTHKGFAMPVAMGVGLILMLLGMTMMVRSQDDRQTAFAQQASAQSLSAAETGITRIQQFINSYRAIAKFPACVNWSAGPDKILGTADDVCTDSGSTVSWKNPANIKNLNSSCTAGSDPVSMISVFASRNWKNIDPSNNSKGQFRLVNYTYDEDSQTGTLIVQGRVNEAEGPGESITELAVAIPNVPNEGKVPGMWIIENSQAGTVQANVFVACNATGTFDIAPGYTLTKVGYTMPDPPPKPTEKIITLTSTPSKLPRQVDIDNCKAGNASCNFNGNFAKNEGTFQYSVPSITNDLDIDAGQKVAIWVDGDINLQGGQKAIRHQCGDLEGCSPFNVKIYGMKGYNQNPSTGVLTKNSEQGKLHLGGNSAICDVFFHAPTYNVSINGGGQAQGWQTSSKSSKSDNPNNNGIYWVRSWDGGGQGNHVALYQTEATWSESPSFRPPPQITAISSWIPRSRTELLPQN